MSDAHSKYEDHLIHHDPKEGFDDTEPDSKSIFGFVVGSVLLLVVVIFTLQFYFDKLWSSLVYENVTSVPSSELATQHSLEDWRLSHYEYTDKAKTAVRIPLDRARALFLEEIKAGKAFYPGKPTEPKPEVAAAPPAAGAPAADAKQATDTNKGKEAAKGKQDKK